MKRYGFYFGLGIFLLAILSCAFIEEYWEPSDVVQALKTAEQISDIQPPTVSFNYPSENQEIGQSNIIIQIRAEDQGSGIASVYYRMNNVNFTIAAYNLSNTFYEIAVTLTQYGFHTNYAYAVDNAGNISETNTRLMERASVPWVTFTKPTQDIFTNAVNIDVEGISGVDAPYSISSVQLKVNSDDWSIITGTTNWFSNGVGLTPGNNTLSIRAISDNGKTNAPITVNVTMQTQLSVAITSPEFYEIVLTNFTVDGTYTCNSSVSNISINIRRMYPIPLWETNINATVDLTNYSCDIYAPSLGSYVIQSTIVSAEMVTNKSAYLFLTLVDFTCQISNPAPETITFTNTAIMPIDISHNHAQKLNFDVFGLISNSSGTNNQTLLTASGVSNRTVFVSNLQVGTNYISIYATNIYGSTPIEKVNVFYDNTKPTIIFQNPSSDGATMASIANFQGLARDTLTPIDEVICYIDSGNQYQTTLNNLSENTNVEWFQLITNISIGNHTFSVTARDHSGNMTTSNITINVIKNSTVYIASDGNNLNGGLLPTEPLLNIQKGIELAESLGISNIYLKEGFYLNGHGLSNSMESNQYAGVNITQNNINILGGWNSDYSAQSGMSTLTGDLIDPFHIIWVQNATNILFDRLNILKGCSYNGPSRPHMHGAGIFMDSCSQITLTNCNVYLNIGWDSGGIYLTNSHNNHLYLKVYNNSADMGGGIYLDYSHSNIIPGMISNNGARSVAGGVYLNHSSDNIISGIIKHNKSDGSVAGCFLDNSHRNTFTGNIQQNYAVSSAGLSLYYSDNNNISGLIGGNISSLLSGGGINLKYSDSNIINATVQNNSITNTFQAKGAGIYLEYSDYNIIEGTVKNNLFGKNGDGTGIHIYYSHFNTLTNLEVFGNSPSYYGGGIFVTNSSNNNISGNIYNNSSRFGGSGLHIAHCTNMYVSGNISNNDNTGFVIQKCSDINWNGNIINNAYRGIHAYQSDHNRIEGLISGNYTPFTGGGINITGSYNEFNCNFSNNTAEQGGSDLSIGGNSNIISGEFIHSIGPSIIYHRGINIFSNINIAGTNGSSSTGLVETSETTNHKIINCTFVTNTLGLLYDDYNGPDLTHSLWYELTNPGSTYHNAATAYGNKVTNW